MVRDDMRSGHSADTPSIFAGPDQRVDPSPSAGDVTRILAQFGQSDGRAATERLLPIVYDELRRLAAEWNKCRPARRFRPPGWFTRRMSGLSNVEKRSTGTVGGTSSPPRSRRCGGSWSNSAGAKDG